MRWRTAHRRAKRWKWRAHVIIPPWFMIIDEASNITQATFDALLYHAGVPRLERGRARLLDRDVGRDAP